MERGGTGTAYPPDGFLSAWLTFNCWPGKMSFLQVSFKLCACKIAWLGLLHLHMHLLATTGIIFKVTSEETRSGKGLKWAWIVDWKPDEVSACIGFDAWFEEVQWSGRVSMVCSRASPSKGTEVVIFICLDPISSSNPILTWESCDGCSTSGKNIGCELVPFLIDSIWNMKHHWGKSEINSVSPSPFHFLSILASPY